jgi:hypothetical protein
MVVATDYDKWAKWAAEASDDDSDGCATPAVTDLGAPMSVTFGGGVGGAPAPPDAPVTVSRDAAAAALAERFTRGCGLHGSSATSSAAAAPDVNASPPVPVQCTGNASPASEQTLYESLVHNGAAADTHLWAQTRTEVTVAVFAPDETRGRHVKVKLQPRRLEVCLSGEVHFSADLAHEAAGEVGADGAEADTIEADWEMLDVQCPSAPRPRRVVKITLQKRSLLPSAVEWWKCVVAGGKEIDVTKIPERQGRMGAARSHAEAWRRAHEMFRERVRDRKKLSV